MIVGLPSNMYPDIKLKDLLGKPDEVAMRDDAHIKTLCSSRPVQGIKTLLPVRPANPVGEQFEDRAVSKRKRSSHDGLDNNRGKISHSSTYDSQSFQQHQSTPSSNQQHLPYYHHQPMGSSVTHQTTSEISGRNGSMFSSTTFDLPPTSGDDSTSQFDGVIIEGGKIIKLERMKQEEIINCTCGFTEEDGLMIQCELCLCWQHAYCNNIQKESEVPEKYVCYICQHPAKERQSAKYLHDQDWLKQGVLPVGSYHSKDRLLLDSRFDKLKRSHDISGGLLELREYLHTLNVKLKIAREKNHPKLYLWSKPWDKPCLPEKADLKLDFSPIIKPIGNDDLKIDPDSIKPDPSQPAQNDSMLMMILKSGKEDLTPIIPRPEAAIDSDDCRLNLLEHISHAENLVEERLDDFEKQLDLLEEAVNVETDETYPKTRHTLQLLLKDLDTLKKFSELPMM